MALRRASASRESASSSSRRCRSQTSPRTSSPFVCRLRPQAVEDCHTRHDEMRALPAPQEMSEVQHTMPGHHIRGRGLHAEHHLLHRRGLPRQALLSLPSRSFPNPQHHRNQSQLLIPFYPPTYNFYLLAETHVWQHISKSGSVGSLSLFPQCLRNRLTAQNAVPESGQQLPAPDTPNSSDTSSEDPSFSSLLLKACLTCPRLPCRAFRYSWSLYLRN